MPIKEPPINPHRFQVVALLAQHFIQDYEAAIQHYSIPQQLELTEHLFTVLTLFRQYHPDEQERLHTQYRESEETLLKKYGKTLKPYLTGSFTGISILKRY